MNSGYRIFLFEDNTELVELLGEIFRLKGDELILFDPESGIAEQVKASKADVLLVDLRMTPPGKVIITELKNDPGTKEIPLLLFTASNIKASEIKAMGVQGVIYKPFSLEEIEKSIDKAIAQRNKASLRTF